MKYTGSCHCGRVAYEVETEPGKALECNCSYCGRRGTLLWFVPRDKLTLKTPEENASVYTFNKHVIKHHFCPDCGCATFGYGVDPSGAPVAAINVRCLDGVDPLKIEKVFYDGRSI